MTRPAASFDRARRFLIKRADHSEHRLVNGDLRDVSQAVVIPVLAEDLPEDKEMQTVLAAFEAALRAKNYEPGKKLGEDEEGLSLISAEKGGNDE